MTLNFGFFNSVRNSEGVGDRRYDARWFAQYFASFIGNGVFPNPSTGLQVVEGSNMTIVIKEGQGWINGYYAVNDDEFNLTLDNADGMFSRIDRVVLRWNQLERIIEFAISKGTYASKPVAPALQRNGDYHELCLAEITVKNGAIRITQSSIKDTRLDKNLCGIVHGLVNQVDTTTLFNQYQTWFAEQMEKYEIDMQHWTAEQQQMFSDWMDQQQVDVTTWTDQHKQSFLDWMAQRQLEYQNWFAQNENDFESWSTTQRYEFEQWLNNLQVLLDGDVAANLAAEILALNDSLYKISTFYFEEEYDEIFVRFPNCFFEIDANENITYMPNGDGNAVATFEDGEIKVWKVV